MSILPYSLAVVILAAGKGSRLGGGKLLLPWRGKPLICHVVDAALSLSLNHPVIIVLGHEHEKVRKAVSSNLFDPDAIRFVENYEWENGQSTSLRTGLSSVMRLPDSAQLKGVMVMLGDQPLVKHETLQTLAERHLKAQSQSVPAKATIPFMNEAQGNPVILSPSLFPKIMEESGDVGARNILADLGNEVNRVTVRDSGVVLDIDSKIDYDTLLRHESGRY